MSKLVAIAAVLAVCSQAGGTDAAGPERLPSDWELRTFFNEVCRAVDFRLNIDGVFAEAGLGGPLWIQPGQVIEEYDCVFLDGDWLPGDLRRRAYLSQRGERRVVEHFGFDGEFQYAQSVDRTEGNAASVFRSLEQGGPETLVGRWGPLEAGGWLLETRLDTAAPRRFELDEGWRPQSLEMPSDGWYQGRWVFVYGEAGDLLAVQHSDRGRFIASPLFDFSGVRSKSWAFEEKGGEVVQLGVLRAGIDGVSFISAGGALSVSGRFAGGGERASFQVVEGAATATSHQSQFVVDPDAAAIGVPIEVNSRFALPAEGGGSKEGLEIVFEVVVVDAVFEDAASRPWKQKTRFAFESAARPEMTPLVRTYREIGDL